MNARERNETRLNVVIRGGPQFLIIDLVTCHRVPIRRAIYRLSELRYTDRISFKVRSALNDHSTARRIKERKKKRRKREKIDVSRGTLHFARDGILTSPIRD